MLKFAKKVTSLMLVFVMSTTVAFAGALDNKKIFIDAGHGGNDPGAVVEGVKEKDLNISIAQKLANILKGNGAEIVFSRTPEKDVYITLADRAKMANGSNADLFVSIHNNASISESANGVEVYYSSSRPKIQNNKFVEVDGNRYEYIKETNENGIEYVYIKVDEEEVKIEKSKVNIIDSQVSMQAVESKEIAQLIVDNLESLGFKNRGAKDGNLYVTKYTTMPAVLVEAGFMTNADELKKLADETMQENIAKQIAQAIYSYYESYENNKNKTFGILDKLEMLFSNEMLLVGQAVNVSIKGMDTKNNFLYRAEIICNDNKVFSSKYSENMNINFVPQIAGEHEITFYVKNKNSNKEFDQKVSGKFMVYKAPYISSLSVGPEKLEVRKNVFIKAEKKEGSIKGTEYGFEVFKGDKIVASKVSESNVFNFIPYDDGDYRVVVRVKDKLSDKQYDDIKEIKFVVERNQEPSRGGSKEQVSGSTKTLNFTRVLRKGMSGTDIKLLQEALLRLGYFKYNTTTTYFGSYTELAVKSFQRENKLVVDGLVGRNTINAINGIINSNSSLNNGNNNQASNSTNNSSNKNNNQSSNSNIINAQNNIIQLKYSRILRAGVIGEDVRQLQQALKILGYFNYPTTTTKFGIVTDSAVRAFQRDNNLIIDGIVGSATINKINERLRSK